MMSSWHGQIVRLIDDVILSHVTSHVISQGSSGPSLEAPQPKPRPQAPPPQPKPRPRSPPTTSDGGIDLDTPEFDEFNLSDEDMAMLAAQMDSANSVSDYYTCVLCSVHNV